MVARQPTARCSLSPISQSENVLFYNLRLGQELASRMRPPTTKSSRRRPARQPKPTPTMTIPTMTARVWCSSPASEPGVFVFANGGNMLNAAGDGYDFTDQTVVDAVTFLKDLWDSGCAFATESYPNPEFAIARRSSP